MKSRPEVTALSPPDRHLRESRRAEWHNGPRMPSGRVHNLINIAAYSVLAAGALYATRQDLLVVTPAQALNFTLAYAAGTFLLSPDLDLAEGKVDSKRHWGVLGVLWVPYGMLFSHRGWSHSWVIGPLTRLLYVALIAALIVGLVRFVAPDLRMPPSRSPSRGRSCCPC